MVVEALRRNTLISYESIMSLFTNERPSELTGLLAENVDLENGIINKYVEPFVGGGAVLIDILQKYND